MDSFCDRKRQAQMFTTFPLRCAGCAFGDPLFIALSMYVGTIVTAMLLLRPITRGIPVWGWPKIDRTRILSLLIDCVWLTPLIAIGTYEHSLIRVLLCSLGLALCIAYLWFRACWILEEHRVEAFYSQIIFLGVIGPLSFVFGTVLGNWLLGSIFIAPTFPMIIVPHTLSFITIATPVGLIMYAGMVAIFPEHMGSPSRINTQSPNIAEQNRSTQAGLARFPEWIACWFRLRDRSGSGCYNGGNPSRNIICRLNYR